MRIAIISIDPSFGSCPGLYKALRIDNEVQCFFEQKDEKGFSDFLLYEIGINNHEKYQFDHYFVVGAGAFCKVSLPRSKTTVVLTDTYFLKNHKTIDLSGVRILCMPDLIQYCKRYDKLYYPPFEWDEDIIKNEELTIAHSPYSEAKRVQKGTAIIEEVVEDLDIIMGVSWVESIRRKSMAHVFIDQVAEREYGYIGTASKSGQEAMAVGCFTLTSGIPVEGEIPPAPAIWVDKYNLDDKLLYYLVHGYDDQVKDQKEWADTYLNYEFQSGYLL